MGFTSIPGEKLMVANETHLRQQRLRYKDYKLLRSGGVEQGRLMVEPGDVKEFDSMRVLVQDLADCGILGWFNVYMGFTKGGG